MEAPALQSENTASKSAGVNLGMYHADANTTIVCFGDPEGNSLKKFLRPDDASSEINTGILMPTVSNLTELDAYLTVSPDGTLSLQPNVILVCLGDVFGDGPDNINIARTLLKLKRDNPTRVILITGNRDLIIQRLPYELQPSIACMPELRVKVNGFVRGDLTAFNDFKFTFQRNEPGDFDYMWDPHPKQISDKKTCLDRVVYVKETMTEYYGWIFLVDEYLTKKGFTSQEIAGITPEVKSYIYVYLVQAMSGGAIKCDVPEFNGIFEELLMAGHLVACIDAGDRGKFGFMHSLPPRGKIPTTPGSIYQEQYNAAKDKPFGFKLNSDGKNVRADDEGAVGNVKDSEIILAAKVEINVGLREFNQSLRNLIKNSRSDRKILRQLLEWVSGITTGSYWLYDNNSKTGANMPFSTVSFGTGFSKFEAVSGVKIQDIQDGGSIKQLEKSIATQYFDTNDFTHFICSHSPKGYVGVKVRTDNGKFYYCVDVSKIDDQEYDVKERFGCCFLVFEFGKEDGIVNDKFIGRIMLKQSQFPKDYDIFTGTTVKDAMFANGRPMFANYVVSPIPISGKNMKQTLPLKMESTDYVFEYIKGGRETRDFYRIPDGFKKHDYFTKMPTLTAVATAGGGSRTRKRRSRYLKKSTRSTHKRRHISKKLKNNNNKRKDKKSKRSSTTR